MTNTNSAAETPHIVDRQLSSLSLRWVVLSTSCIAMAGGYYSMDIPAALHQQLKDYMIDETSNFAIKFNLLYSVYSIPNIILPFFGGTLVDKLGPHQGCVIFASISALGQILFAMGIQAKNWNVMLLGRTVYGFGGESISVASSALTARWFKGKELALAFGINLAVSRLGSVVNNLVSPWLANTGGGGGGGGNGGGGGGVRQAVWFGALLNVISVLAMCLVYWLDKVGEEKCRELNAPRDLLNASLLEEDCLRDNNDDNVMGRNDENDNGSPSPLETNADDENEEEGEGSSTTPSTLCSGGNLSCISQLSTFGTMFWLLSASCVVVYGCILPFNSIASGILLERNYFIEPMADCQLLYPGQCSSGTLAPVDGNPAFDSNGNTCPTEGTYQRPTLPTSIHIDKDTTSSSSSSWDKESYNFDNLVDDDVDCGDPFWSEGCTKTYCLAQNQATQKAGKIMSIPYFLSALCSPFFGHIIDQIGCRAIIASFASIMLILVHSSLAIMVHSSPVIPLIGQGLAYSCYAAVIWPSVPFTVEESYTGTAFGAITAIQNIGLSFFPIIIAFVYNNSGERYIPNVEYFFVICAVVGTLIGVVLNVMDRKTGGALNKVHKAEDSTSGGGNDENETSDDVDDEVQYTAPLLSPDDDDL